MWMPPWRARSMVSRVAVVLVTAALGVGVAAAAGPEADTSRASTETLLREAEGSPHKAVVAEMSARSRAALERAARLRGAGDEPHARLADALARTWAETARDVVRAVGVEEKAQAARRGATDAGAVAERERALLEEGIAQTGRLRAQVEGAERESKQQPARTSAAANDPDAGVTRPKATTKDAGAAGAAAPPAPAFPVVRDGGAR